MDAISLYSFMTRYHDSDESRPARVKEPVQVYLSVDERKRLDRLTTGLGTTKSEVLRKGLEALELQLTDPEHHPALAIIGIVGEEGADSEGGRDPARDHDRLLADAEETSWHGRGEPGGP